MDPLVTEVLETLSRELRTLARSTSALQDQLSPQAVAAVDIQAFQSLDVLNQTLDCLAIFAADVAAAMPCSCRVSIDGAASKVWLAALAERLRGNVIAAAGAALEDVELF